MAFRDDREALRAKGKVLEGEVERLRADLDRTQRELAEHESKDERDEEELARLRREVGAYRKRLGVAESSSSKAPKGAIVAAMIGVLAAGGSGFLVLRSSDDGVSAPVPVPADPLASSVESAPVAEPVAPIEPVHFGAVVLKAEGLDLEPGDGCVITANLVASGDVAGVRVVCDELVYDSKMEGGVEMTSSSWNAVQYEAAGQRFRHMVVRTDVGTRTGPRPQLDLNTQGQRARIWRENGEPFDLRLYVDFDSSVRVGEALGGHSRQNSHYQPLHLRATVRSSGPHPEAIDAGCELVGRAAGAGTLDCRLMLRCGESIVYGGGTSGYNRCGDGADRARIDVADDVGITREDGDPSFALRASERRLTIADERHGERWEAELTLDEDPRCNLDGRWTGWTATAEAEQPLSLEGSRDEQLRVETREGPIGATVELDCLGGEGVITAGDSRYEGRFGPGFATFIGRVEGPAPASFVLRRR